jgi:hypothetical protein
MIGTIWKSFVILHFSSSVDQASFNGVCCSIITYWLCDFDTI